MEERTIRFKKLEDVEDFVKAAEQCDFDIDIRYQHVYIDAKSILGVLGLGLKRDLTVNYYGENERFENTLKNYEAA